VIDLSRLLHRIKCWLFPMAGWKDRLVAVRDGNNVWPVADHSDISPFFPWPPEWCVWEAAPPTWEGGPRTPRFLNTVSMISGRIAEGDYAVRCSRCGIHLHSDEANMRSNVDVPACYWCVGAVRRVR